MGGTALEVPSVPLGIHNLSKRKEMKRIVTHDFVFWQSSCLAKAPMGSSQKLAKKAISYMTSATQQIFEKFNQPQLAAIQAALTRRLTLIQGKLQHCRW